MKLNIIDIVSSAMRAVNKTLRNMVTIIVTEMPAIRRDDVLSIKIMASDSTFTSTMMFKQASKEGGLKGGMVVYISSYNIKNLFGTLGYDDSSNRDELKDVCGEFCNVIAGALKTELSSLGYEDIELSIPENFYGVMNEDLDIRATTKYLLNFSYEGKPLLSLDIFMEKESVVR